MSLVPHKITALAESDAQGTSGKNIVAGAIVSLYDTDGAAVTLFDNEAGANGSTAKQTDATGQVVVYVTPGEYDEEVSGSIKRRVAIGGNGVTSYPTTASLESSRPSKTGQRAENQERANAQYILAPSGYTALPGDIAAANGRVWALQKSSEGWNFYHFGVRQTNTATQNTAAFQSAIERAGGSPICGAGGFFSIDGQVTLSQGNSGIVSTDGKYIDIKQVTDGLSCLKVSPATPEDGSTVNNIKIRDVRLIKSTATPSQVALELLSVNGSDIVNLSTLGCHTAVKIRGCKDIRGNNWLLFAGGGGITYQAGTALIDADEFPLSNGNYTPFWTSSISNITASCQNLCDFVFDVGYADGFQLSNGYLASPKKSHFNLKPRRSGGGIAKLLVDNFYLDGINTATGSESAITVPSDGLAGTFVAESKFSNCGMSNFTGNIVNLSRSTSGLEFNNCTLSNAQGWAMSGSVSSGGVITLLGGEVSNVGIDGLSGGVSLTGYGNATISSVNFRGVPNNYAISTTNCGRVARGLNTFSNVAAYAIDSGSLKVKDVGSLSNTQDIVDQVGLVRSWTPVVNFGGGATGITYTTQKGSTFKIGKLVHFSAEIELSSKGSSVGSLAITGLPYVSNSQYNTCSVEMRSLTAGVGESHLQGGIPPGGTGISFSLIQPNGFRLPLDDGDITNNTFIAVSGSYLEG